jgi:hypothetical protein
LSRRASFQPFDRGRGAAEARAEFAWLVKVRIPHRLVGAVDIAAIPSAACLPTCPLPTSADSKVSVAITAWTLPA